MQPMKNFLDGYAKRFQKIVSTPQSPIRPRDKKTRLWIDNEYFEKRYAAAFPQSVSLVYAVLAKYANARTQSCWPSAQTIMSEAGVASRETLFSAIKMLEAHSIIAVCRSKGRHANTYTLLDCRAWLPPNSAGKRTVQVEVDSTVTESQQYRNDPSNSTKNSTPIHRMKSEKEIMEDLSFEKKENALEGNLLATLDPMKRITIIKHFDATEAEGALKNLVDSGSILENLQIKEIVHYLRQSGVTETEPIRWL
jgi:hypothetical protein